MLMAFSTGASHLKDQVCGPLHHDEVVIPHNRRDLLLLPLKR
jgi:hypothetical protein